MRFSRRQTLLFISLLLACYYLAIGAYLHSLGYSNRESLFYIEKTKILVDGIGERLQVMGLTSPLLPFYGSFLFSFAGANFMLAPIFASAIGTAALFFVIASTLVKRKKHDYFLFLITILFIFHPGILFAAASGKAIYMALVFFYLFFLNILKYYDSNTTFNVSISSICLLLLIFCDYKFIWLSLFFVPLILSISIQTLNLGERESIFRLFLSFNNPSLRRKLINKTVAIYLIIFILPLATIWVYEMLNLTHANDLEYFIRSPYATWNVLSENSSAILNSSENGLSGESSLLTSVKVLLFCPLVIVALYLYRKKAYQILTLFTPFALVEFLKIKYEQIYLPQEYYLMFIVLAILCIGYKSWILESNVTFKAVLTIVVLLQLYTGFDSLIKSDIPEEKNFITCLTKKVHDDTEDENRELANCINNLPPNSQVLMDDAISYPIAAFTKNIKTLVLPYQDSYLGAVEGPGSANNYMLIATPGNPASGYSQLNLKYLNTIETNNSSLRLYKVYETQNWTLYSVSKD